MEEKNISNKGFSLILIIISISALIIISIGIYLNFYKSNVPENESIQTETNPQATQPLPILDLSKAKKIDKLVDGFLIVIEIPQFSSSDLEPVAYLGIVPNLDDIITQDNISILASYKNPNDFGFTIYGNDIYYIDTLNSYSNPENGEPALRLFEEQNIYRFNLDEMKSKQLINNKFKNPTFESGDEQFIRRLIFDDSKMYFVANSDLYEHDLTLGKSTILKNFPKKEGAMLGVDKALGPNIIEKIENNKLLLDLDTCPFIKVRQGGCNPGGYQISYNLLNKEVKEERFNPDYREEECNITKIENGKLTTVKYENSLENEQCQKKFKLVDSNYSIQDPFIQRK